MSTRLTALLSAAMIVSCVRAAQAEQYVVEEARGIDLRPGTRLDSNRPLQLQPGQHVTVLTEAGELLQMDGPYGGAPARGYRRDASTSTSFAGFLTESGSRPGDYGSTRGTNTDVLPDPWVIDASHGGSVCLRESATPVFWRPAATSSANFVLMPSDRSWKASSVWPAGTDRISVRTDVVVHGGASYIVSLNGAESPIVVNSLPDTLVNDRMRAAWMVAKGCAAQAQALLGASR
jgi:hypothetical protein